MIDTKGLYEKLLELRSVIEHGDKKEIDRLSKEFSFVYKVVLRKPEMTEGSLEHLFDLARNSSLYAIDPNFPAEERKRYLEIANGLTSQIEQQISAIPNPS